MRRTLTGVVAGLALAAAAGTAWWLVTPAHAQDEVVEHPLLDNDKVTVTEYTFPAGFHGEEHAAIANEFAYVLDGDFTVVTRGRGKRVVHPGDVEYASEGTVHTSLNETRKPARVLVVILKDR